MGMLRAEGGCSGMRGMLRADDAQGWRGDAQG